MDQIILEPAVTNDNYLHAIDVKCHKDGAGRSLCGKNVLRTRYAPHYIPVDMACPKCWDATDDLMRAGLMPSDGKES